MRVRNDLLKLLGLCLLAGVLVAGLLFPAVGAFGVVSNQASDTVDSVSADLVTTDLPLVTTVTDKDGAPIAYVYDQYRVLTPPDKIAPAMKAALISVEDRRFYEHHGVDWPGTLRALVTNQVNGSVSQGASTLTQQYVKNYLVHVVARNNKVEQQRAQEQTIARKLREARIAMQLESKLSKEDILARYLNTVPFGSTIYGIAAASQAYFNTTPDQLTVPQAAMLAGMVNSPSALDPERYPEKALDRRNRVIDKMVENQRLSPEAGEAAKKEPLGLADPVRTPPNGCVGAGPENGFFCSYVLNYLQKVGFSAEQLETGGYTIRTTLDRTATEQAKQAAEAQVPKSTNGIANTIAIVTPGSDRHNVVALAANRDYGLKPEEGQTTYDLPSGVENKFGAGSVYKIFTAASALEKGMGIENVIQTPASYTSKVFKNNGAPYSLTNNTPNYPASMTLQQALATSPNTGFVILEERVGMDSVVDMASRLGLRETMASNVAGETPNPKAEDRDRRTSQSEFFKPKRGNAGNGTFTLGPTAVSTLELANVAATLMSGGRWCPPTPVLQITDRQGQPVKINEPPCEQVVPKELADTLVIGLSKDDQGSGTSAAAAKKYEWKRPMMGKTGTTQDAKSAAFVGATPQFAGAVQTFNDGTAPRPICDSDPPKLCAKGDIYGGKVPARTWFDAMTKIHGSLPVATLPSPTERYVKGGSEIRIPNVIGKPVDAARQDLEKAGYQVATRNQNSEKAKGIVVSQSPRGSALPGETITLYVSTGYVPPPQSDPEGGHVSGSPSTPPTSTPNPSKPTTPSRSPAPINPSPPNRPGG
ncbi:penicillin-binding protein [Goodfellowiella coeruleoviolacea]|uniref:Membrane carboxypeptidase (Penicillin-binding protein) n=1 Tax=Goodfellowiella coeruleoviolacea TaxID=334858 RepID=A0AAE3GED5_9PSEU|nr:penicillin-binding protein [Goodfellowiella coeruleoviolacea]MCP2164593.1 Membrane carboxypeptidase (penicillin-binding protein) [Goodfellowiella coeruleoviolacea]